MERGVFGYATAATGRPAWPNYDTNFKMNPPLRSRGDREAIIAGLVDGTLEILGATMRRIATTKKEVEFDYAPFGITGLETELSLSLMQLYHTKRLGLAELIAKFTVAPARLFAAGQGDAETGRGCGRDGVGPDLEWVFGNDGNRRASRPTARFMVVDARQGSDDGGGG